jgi:hypothetical protein
VATLTIPFRITKGKLVAYLAWKLTGLGGQEVGKVDPATEGPDLVITKATKVPEGGAGEAQLSDGVVTVRPNPPRLRRKVTRREADPTLGRPDPAMTPRDARGRAGGECSCLTLGCDSWMNPALARSCSLGVGGSMLTSAPTPSDSCTGGAASAAGKSVTSPNASASSSGGAVSPVYKAEELKWSRLDTGGADSTTEELDPVTF